jgi:hypothetical protein
VSLPPSIQSLYDQMVQALQLQALKPCGLDINVDGDGIVQDVKPKLVYRRERRTQPR